MFQHLVSLDVSHNAVEVLVVSALRGLRELYAANNALQHLSLHGASLRTLRAPHNRELSFIFTMSINQLVYIVICADCITSTKTKEVEPVL